MATSPTVGKKRILLVDDSNAVLLMEKALLGRLPYILETALDGQEAIDKATKAPPDLILMDVVMPRLGGFDACRALRAHPATKGVPIILVTTRAEADNVQRGYECGCNDYIAKPINAVELIEKVSTHLGAG